MLEGTAGHGLITQLNLADHFKTPRVDASWLELDDDNISHVHGRAEVCMAMHNRQGHAGLIGASTGEDGTDWYPEPFKALFPGLMAPPHEVLKMHHPGGIGVAETHRSVDLQPWVGVHCDALSMLGGTVTLTSILLRPMAAPIAFEQPSIQKAWDAFQKHIPVLLVIWVGSIALAVLGLVVSMLIVMAVGSLGGSSDSAFSLGAILGQLTQIPFSILSSLLSVLMVAIPAVYYERGEVVSIGSAVALLRERFWRYVLAGLFFSVVMTIGFLFCVLPGLAVALVTPVYVNRIFVTEMSIGEAFSHAFQVVYRSENGMSFVGLEVLAAIVAAVLAVVTCGLAGLVVIPMASFYLQNTAYQRGLLR